MPEQNTEAKPFDSRIPWLIVVPFLAITVIWIWGFNQFKSEAELEGSFALGEGIRKVRILTDVGNIDVMIGSAGEVTYEAKTLRAAGSQQLLDRALVDPFDLERVPSEDPSELVLRVTPLSAGFVRLPEVAGAEKDQESPRLFRQFNARITVPVNVALEIEASEGNLRIDTRQAETTVTVGKGNLMLINVSAPLTVYNRGGDTMIAEQRGPLDAHVTGRTRATLAEVTGPVTIANEDGEVGLYIPAHASVDLVARSSKGGVRNGFGFETTPLGTEGQVCQGKLGAGTHKVLVVTKKGALTVTTGADAK